MDLGIFTIGDLFWHVVDLGTAFVSDPITLFPAHTHFILMYTRQQDITLAYEQYRAT